MFGSNITTTKFPLAKEGYQEAIELQLADGSTTTFQKKGKLRISDSYIDCVELDVNSPNLLSISQLGYTAIFTDQKTFTGRTSHKTPRYDTKGSERAVSQLGRIYCGNSRRRWFIPTGGRPERKGCFKSFIMSTPHTVELSNCYKFNRSLNSREALMAKSRMTLHLMSTQMPHNCLTPAKVGTTSRPTTNISRQKSFRTHLYAGYSYHAERLALRLGSRQQCRLSRRCLSSGTQMCIFRFTVTTYL